MRSLLIAVLLICAVSCAYVPTEKISDFDHALVTSPEVRNAIDASFLVRCDSKNGKRFGFGTGVHIGSGYVLTARHVVMIDVPGPFGKFWSDSYEGNMYILSNLFDCGLKAEVINVSKRYDLALLRCKKIAKMPSVQIDFDHKEYVSEPVFLIGHSSLQKQYHPSYISIEGTISYIIGGPIYPGYSGGGTFDRRGRLIGINVSILGIRAFGTMHLNEHCARVVSAQSIDDFIKRGR